MSRRGIVQASSAKASPWRAPRTRCKPSSAYDRAPHRGVGLRGAAGCDRIRAGPFPEHPRAWHTIKRTVARWSGSSARDLEGCDAGCAHALANPRTRARGPPRPAVTVAHPDAVRVSVQRRRRLREVLLGAATAIIAEIVLGSERRYGSGGRGASSCCRRESSSCPPIDASRCSGACRRSPHPLARARESLTISVVRPPSATVRASGPLRPPGRLSHPTPPQRRLRRGTESVPCGRTRSALERHWRRAAKGEYDRWCLDARGAMERQVAST